MDAQSRREFYVMLVHLNRDLGITIVLTSHEIHSVTKLASRIASSMMKPRENLTFISSWTTRADAPSSQEEVTLHRVVPASHIAFAPASGFMENPR